MKKSADKPNNEIGEVKKHTPEFRINPGTASILLIFVTLCLVSFSVLSLVSANSDKKLNDKVLTRTTEYYEACNRAQEVLAQIDDELLESYYLYPDEDEYYSHVGRSRSMVIDVTSTQNLNVSIAINYPTSKDEAFYTISNWSLEDKATITID